MNHQARCASETGVLAVINPPAISIPLRVFQNSDILVHLDVAQLEWALVHLLDIAKLLTLS
jgi:hypothetical protein